MSAPKCTSWFGHKFRARYSIGAPDLSRFTSLKGYGADDLVNAMKPQTYIHDICVRCGHVVLAPSSPNGFGGRA